MITRPSGEPNVTPSACAEFLVALGRVKHLVVRQEPETSELADVYARHEAYVFLQYEYIPTIWGERLWPSRWGYASYCAHQYYSLPYSAFSAIGYISLSTDELTREFQS